MLKHPFLATAGCVLLFAAGACGNDSPSQQPAPGSPFGGSAGTAANAGGAGNGAVAAAAGLANGAGQGGNSASGGATSGGNAGAGRANGGASAGGGAFGAGGNAGNAATSGGAPAGAGGSTGGVAGSQAGAGGRAAGGAAGRGPRPTVTAAPGTTLVKVDAGKPHQTFEGFGTSLCWWANHVGGWDADARNAFVAAVVDPVDGLGYNVFRYNIGGGENPSHEHMDDFREMPGFEPSAGTWNWDADENQRAILQRIVDTGTGVILEAFSNSPPHWMTKSGCASGSSDGSNNLKDDAYDDFADYLTEVVKHFRDTAGIRFRTLEPLNEPNANWWKSNGSQEGCHFSPSNQESIIQAVAAALASKGLTDTSVSASDENSLDDAYNNLRAFKADTLAAVAQMNAHSYNGSRRTELRALATSKNKRLWQSESGPLSVDLADDTEAALFMAGRIITDLRDMGAEAWVDWQVGDPSRNWASFALNDQQQSFSRLKRFYMHAGFSRYIRPGATFVDIDDPDMVAAVSADGATLAVVARNGSTTASKAFTFDLTTLASVGSSVTIRRTSRTEDLASVPAVAIEGYSFVATLPAYSVTTFVVPLQ